MIRLIVMSSFFISFICLSSQSWALKEKWFPTDRINCLVLNPDPQNFETVIWSGECSNGKANGIGILTWSIGDKYIGEYVEGKMHGQGTYTWDKGDQYTGLWQNNKFYGKGSFIYANGDKYEGEYKDGKFHGQGVYTFANGGIIDGFWENGKKVEPTKT